MGKSTRKLKREAIDRLFGPVKTEDEEDSKSWGDNAKVSQDTTFIKPEPGHLQVPHGSDIKLEQGRSKTPHLKIFVPTSPQTTPSSLSDLSTEVTPPILWSIKYPIPSPLLLWSALPLIPHKSKDQKRSMDPLNWSNGTRANRPFQENLQRLPQLRDPDHPILSPPRPARRNTSAYFREQLHLARPAKYKPPRICHSEPGIVKKFLFGVLEWVRWIVILLAAVFILPVVGILGLLTAIPTILFFTVTRSLKGLLYLPLIVRVTVRDIIGWIKWEPVLILFLAFNAAKLLPGLGNVDMDESERSTWNQAKPVYVVGMQNGYAYGSGPVLQ